jgi:hypothetical protein
MLKNFESEEEILNYIDGNNNCLNKNFKYKNLKNYGNMKDFLIEYTPIFPYYVSPRILRKGYFEMKELNTIINNLLFNLVGGRIKNKILTENTIKYILENNQFNVNDVCGENIKMSVFCKICASISDGDIDNKEEIIDLCLSKNGDLNDNTYICTPFHFLCLAYLNNFISLELLQKYYTDNVIITDEIKLLKGSSPHLDNLLNL